MSLKTLARKIFPSSLLPYLQIPYRLGLSVKHRIFWRTAAERIIAEAEKFLPHYQDELSREILADRIEYLRTNDVNIFLRRAKKEGWKFHGIYREDNQEYSRMLVVYDYGKKELDYAKSLAELLNINARFMPLREFLRNGHAEDSELVALIVGKWHWNLCRNSVKDYLSAHNMHCDFTMTPVAIREDDQYVDVFSPNDSEIIVDAGAYTGDTALRFLKWGRRQNQARVFI